MKHPVVRALAACALATVALGASAQQIWKWRDAQGQVHVSDHPPPAGASVLQKPSGTPITAADLGANATSAPAAAAAPAASGAKPAVDPELARRKAEADKKKADLLAQQQAQQKQLAQQQCAAAREQLRVLGSGVRIVRVNDKGEREYMDDAGKAEQARQAQAIADKACQGQ